MRKVVTVLLVLLVVGLLVDVVVGQAQRVGNNQGYEPDQPIPFSHKIHAGENRIDCRYCHFASERGRHAGIPPTQVCMNCHEQVKKEAPDIVKLREAIAGNKPVRWVRVHQLAAFVYFNHSEHVRGGVNCQQCHGPVESMTRMKQFSPLSMGWCLDCHRKSGTAPPQDHKTAAGGDCARCHY
jgi:hypothetical protein